MQDEIDKIVSSSEYRQSSADASSEGVQRDLLPIIEGSIVSTKHGNVNTDQILFIASGAFHSCKPSDMLAELQGRLPIKVELKGLTKDDLHRIMTEPEAGSHHHRKRRHVIPPRCIPAPVELNGIRHPMTPRHPPRVDLNDIR